MIGEAIVLVGATFMLLAAIGVIRFDHPLARMHALSKASTLGVILMIVGAAVNLDGANDITSAVLAAILHLLTSPPASNMVARAIYVAGGSDAGVVIDEGAEPLGLRAGDPGGADPG